MIFKECIKFNIAIYFFLSLNFIFGTLKNIRYKIQNQLLNKKHLKNMIILKTNSDIIEFTIN